jgi:hypothetical protein
MTAAVESGARIARRPDRRSWLRWGAWVFVAVETVHLAGGLLANDWEGWGTFFGNLSFIVVSGLLVVFLTYGTLVRWGLKSSEGTRNRPALASLIAGSLLPIGCPTIPGAVEAVGGNADR